MSRLSRVVWHCIPLRASFRPDGTMTRFGRWAIRRTLRKMPRGQFHRHDRGADDRDPAGRTRQGMEAVSTETDTTHEAALVLYDHWAIGRNYECKCGTETGDPSKFVDHVAAMLAEAGLLREDVDLRRRITREVDAKLATARDLNRLQVQMGRLTEERAAECIGNAFSTWATDPTVRDAARRVVAMVQAQPRHPQIATQGPAEQPSAGSAGRGASGGSAVGPEAIWDDDAGEMVPMVPTATGGAMRNWRRFSTELDPKELIIPLDPAKRGRSKKILDETEARMREEGT